MTREPQTADRAYTHVRDRLLDGAYPGGALLSEGAVAAELGISRTPVREAFLRLQSEGFLRLYPKRGALVVPVNPGEAQAVLQARLLMDLFALDAVAARGPEALRETGEALLKAARAEEGEATPARAREIGHAFHTNLVRAGGNPVLTEMYNNLWDRQIRIASASLTGPGHATEDVGEHLAIAEALHDARPAEARTLLTRHVTSGLTRMGFVGDPTLPPPASS